ncbi:polysaccharide biosynthesis protein [Natronolimnohabitans innermongolicus]|uniref:Polysaccharide biosynthesis protein CapD n=1 Tax=Natronolimnohabitans innermongolicus JCM 12255 TaxID=1227499 RepID=L9WGJ1_9EURY|nr:polysaccharide biosynthesis protein [Natronolimnohabitans innermongolicus]ELY48610.1 polysaccharide biosynthesis protein CapD [Natronolimnohabitans innermongolicus JCM 12255]
MISEQEILLTGAGSVGQSLIPRLLERHPTRLRVLDNDESRLAKLRAQFDDPRLEFLVGNVRDGDCLERAMTGFDDVIHTAAMKHVDVCQYDPYEAVKTNVVGVQNVVDAAVDANVERLVFTSSDKAVNPANAMGTTKLLSEQLVAAHRARADHDLRLASVRFGNVINSSQSVVPRFAEQIRSGGPVTLTDERMTRFFLTYDDVFDLVSQSLERAYGGEIYVYKMPAIRIVDLANAMIEAIAPQYGYDSEEIEIELIGRRPGETFHEEIMTDREVDRAHETDSLYAIRPESVGDERGDGLEEFTSATDVVRSSGDAEKLTQTEIVSLLRESGLDGLLDDEPPAEARAPASPSVDGTLPSG